MQFVDQAVESAVMEALGCDEILCDNIALKPAVQTAI